MLSDGAAGHKYWNLHVDKANRHAYDYSALLYLNSHCADPTDCDLSRDFEGGLLSFQDTHQDVYIMPKAGRLVLFTGGLENLHTVHRVTNGTRYVLAMWFSCSRDEKYVDQEPNTPLSTIPRELALPKPQQLNAPRTDCGYAGITELACVARGCQWDDTVQGVPWCFT